MNKPTIPRKLRVLLAKPGLDGHDKGGRVIAMLLRDAGFEVIYTGLHQTIDGIVSTAVQEDVNVIGLSILSGAHLAICDQLMRSLKEKDIEDIKVVVGGTIPENDFEKLREYGVVQVFPNYTSFRAIKDYFSSLQGVNALEAASPR